MFSFKTGRVFGKKCLDISGLKEFYIFKNIFVYSKNVDSSALFSIFLSCLFHITHDLIFQYHNFARIKLSKYSNIILFAI